MEGSFPLPAQFHLFMKYTILQLQSKCFCNNAEKLPFENNHFDYYTISFGIRNIENINNALNEAFRVLKPGGRFLCLEFSKVKNEILNKFYKIYLKFRFSLLKILGIKICHPV